MGGQSAQSFLREQFNKEKPGTMVVTPLHSKDEDGLGQLILLFRHLGCDIYKDTAGQCYAVAPSREMMPESLSVVFETDHLPEDWTLDN